MTLTEIPDRLARALAHHSSWSVGSPPVEWIQTHISHVFLVGERVFKLRKAVRLPFLDFASRQARNADCLREVALNRRLAPDVYLGVAPILVAGSTVRIGTIEESIGDPSCEHVVVMRRLPKGRDALSLLEAGRLEPRHLEAIAQRLREFHADQALGSPAPFRPADWLERIARPALDCVTALVESGLLPRERTQAIEARLQLRLDAVGPALEERRVEGRAVDGHGDLHLDHAWFERDSADPLLVDCIEFNADLRRIDRASEVAFLAMDLRYRERPDLAEWFLADYAASTDDYGLFRVVDFYASYRALVRAKVAALAASQASITQEQRGRARESVEAHVTLAESLLEDPALGGVILLCGTVGSGKSTVAREIGRSGGGIPIVSDRVRKVLAGLGADEHAPAEPDQGLYSPDEVARVYRGLLERASPLVESGRTAILDASFASRARRDEARAWAAERGIPIRLIEVRCSSRVALERLRERSRQGIDPSDAGPEFLATSEKRFEAPDEWPEADREIVFSDR